MTDPDLHHILIYDYVPDMAQRRIPFRDQHLERILHERDTGRIAFAGAFDPPTGGAIVFHGVDREHVKRFAAADPYVINGLVTRHRIERWNIIGGH
ncbi:MAG: YciI family protein [Solirubrobacteraceae bacterium]